MMFLNARDVGALKVSSRRSGFPCRTKTGGEDPGQTRGPKQKSKWANDVPPSIGDPISLHRQEDSHQKSNFLFLRSVFEEP
jgi:hypothetical protein